VNETGLAHDQLLEEGPLGWVAGELLSDSPFDFMCLVDSQRGVELDGAASWTV
jgi:hypothetical protein